MITILDKIKFKKITERRKKFSKFTFCDCPGFAKNVDKIFLLMFKKPCRVLANTCEFEYFFST